MELGLHYGIPLKEYLADEAINKSFISDFTRNPYYAKWRKDNPQESTEMHIGSIAHTAILEPEYLDSQLVIQPEEIKVRRGKAWDEFQAANPDKIILTDADYQKVLRMVESVKRHPNYAAILTGGQAEMTAIWDHPSGLVMKSRSDYLNHFVIGLKTSSQPVDPSTFSRTCGNFSYHWSAALEQEGVYRTTGKMRDYIFVAVEQEPPHGCAMYMLKDTAIDLAWQQLNEQLELIKICIDEDAWPRYHVDTMEIDLPRWAYTKEG